MKEKNMDRKEAKNRTDEIIGKNIRLEREARNITRGEMAKILGITPSHVGLIERGERGTTSVSLSILSNAFGMTIDELFDSKREEGSTVREDNDMTVQAYRRKISTMVSNLDEAELEFTINVIKGVQSMNAARA